MSTRTTDPRGMRSGAAPGGHARKSTTTSTRPRRGHQAHHLAGTVTIPTTDSGAVALTSEMALACHSTRLTADRHRTQPIFLRNLNPDTIGFTSRFQQRRPRCALFFRIFSHVLPVSQQVVKVKILIFIFSCTLNRKNTRAF